MLHIIQSNRMEILSAQLCALLANTSSSNIFHKEQVLVHSPGMSQWLKLELTAQLGVCAQVDFPLPSSFIWSLYQQALPDVPPESSFNKANMTWKLYELLPQKLTQAHYQPLMRYLEGDDDGHKRYALCEKIADVFDHYLMYRPQWLASWQAGEDQLDDVDISHAPWQPDLWRALVARVQELEQSPYHRANMHQGLLDALAAGQLQLPPRICLFGISALAQSQLAIFQALSEHTDVLIFLFNPSEHYWGDIVDEKTLAKIHTQYQRKPNVDAAESEQQYFIVGNPLLASWGKLGRDYLEQLLQLDGKWLDGFDDEFAPHLLGRLQQEVYELAFKGESLAQDPHWFISEQGKIALAQQDHSLLISNCHTALREVECLHDHLLAEFARDPTLTPKDIIVMMPDVGQYSAFIEAVFGGAKGERHIPYAIADLSIAQEQPIVNALVSLVNLPFSRFGVSELMDLLYIEAISQHFGFVASELEQCQVWLEQVGVKWGIDGAHKQEFNLPSIDLNTWRLGIKRLLLGIAATDAPYHGVYPADAVEGMASDTLSKLLAFINVLLQAKQALSGDASLLDKCTSLRAIASEVMAVEHLSAADLALLDGLYSDIEKHYDNGDYQGLISARIFATLIQQGVEQKGVGQRFLIGKVNFCTLMPMRAVPFKKVCILGLNDADYPRSVQPIGFDLVPYSQRRKGDRSRRLDDRYLFLEALLSARDSLYLSYIGRSSRDNSPRMPSVLVSELCEYLDRSFCWQDSDDTFTSRLVMQHHLQPFHPQYYQKDSRWQSFNPVWALPLTAAQEQKQQLQPLAVTAPQLCELDTLMQCVTRPQRYFYQQVLGVRIDGIDAHDEDIEHFDLDALSRYQLLDELLEGQLHGSAPSDEEIIQRGVLPQGVLSTLTLQQLRSRISPLAEQVQLRTQGQMAQMLEVDITVSGVRLQGWLAHLYGSQQVFYRSASIKAKDRIQGFIYHLLAQLCGEAVTTVVMGLDEQVSFAPMNAERAEQLLEPWLELFTSSHQSSVAFFPASAWEWIQSQDMNKANIKFVGSPYVGVAERSDPYIATDFADLFQCEQEFCDWSTRLLQPIAQLGEEQRYADA
ncbi:exodeoxyribonuclease V subunit gamma [Pseudoalteromonas sp. Cnat2-41]|uniref:exodeoxyribonuclease V subunit gamma n=1 Tax=unclassified Pseudoalteromonas TaxID=194690 RepID=UPI001EF86E40|nr:MULTISPECIES: exodeoxyribonuclease V subunit gamma [unclassified Pseudoalteromonas]MCF2861789.1 exodeoxyribonuclease V subunit gamma [Pseudoalteromonas sp. CNAT2-18]MCG7557172.1 exodeoxyribonuclease V subunit gamma [Pseudoalteromonas sp. CNAT2-18.1]